MSKQSDSWWTLGRRLGAGMAAMVALCQLTGLMGYLALGAVAESTRVIDAASADLIDAQSLRADSLREVSAVRGFVLSGQARFRRDAAAADRRFDATRTTMTRRASGRALSGVDAIEAAEDHHQQSVDRFFEMRRRGDAPDALNAYFEATVVPRHEALLARIDALIELRTDARDAAVISAAQTREQSTRGLLLLAVLGLLLAMLIAYVLTRSTTRSVSTAVTRVRSSSTQLSATAAQQATGARELATTMNEVATTATELLASARQIAETAGGVSSSAERTADAAAAGIDGVEATRQKVAEVSAHVDALVEHMLGLGRRSQEIGVIVKLIDELAEQTNILAINASIEAAGAGEHGRRFAVVGEEIRKLAGRVSDASRDITALIGDIRGAVNTTVMATEASAKSSSLAGERFAELASGFGLIGDLVEGTLEASREIELATRQQSSAVEQVSLAIADATTTTREAESAARQTAETADELVDLSSQLEGLVKAAT